MSSIAPEDPLPPPQRRIRHISSLQIRNLTPFPIRDALAQNLTHYGSNGPQVPLQHVDDIELTMTRRKRRISSSSAASMFSTNVDDVSPFISGGKKQTRSASKGSGSTKNISPVASNMRQKSQSGTSLLQDNEDSVPVTASPLSTLFVTHSQRALEEIVLSRLVETFITLTLEFAEEITGKDQGQGSTLPVLPSPTVEGSKGKIVGVKRAASASTVAHRRGTSVPAAAANSISTPSSRSNRSHSFVQPGSPSVGRKKPVAPSKSRTRPSSATTANFPSPPPTPPPGPSRLKSESFLIKSSKATFFHDYANVTTPFYISPIHAPSINPIFGHLDPEREFASWTDTSKSLLRLSLWGRKTTLWPNKQLNFDVKGKGKDKVTHLCLENEPRWRILDEWLVDLNQMQPLDSSKSAPNLPYNTLLLTLSSGEVFEIPPISLNKPVSRAPTPMNPGYSSDGEIEELRHKNNAYLIRTKNAEGKQEQEVLDKSKRETRMKKSATWQDLVKLVNLQTAAIDTRELLEEVIRKCDSLLEDDGYLASLRECSEREERISMLRREKGDVLANTRQVRENVTSLQQAMLERRENLVAAQALLNVKVSEQKDLALDVISQRDRFWGLSSSLTPTRASLIQEVSFIYPIEPLSPPDLLFTILGVPLPIPINASDPAPPLSLPSFPDVTEDNTATALGHVAQVLQFVSAYLGKTLVYPVTCCGSRSVVKDPISAMMGPRTFPLYNKGVDTYRYEYGVFLLNKNIEMLMTERNLRAMDIRHTLPNLKNLLLTLTTGEEVKPVGFNLAVNRVVSVPAVDAQVQSEDQSIPGRPKSTPFLSPLAAILRARYPSSMIRPSVKVVAEVAEPPLEEVFAVQSSDGPKSSILENSDLQLKSNETTDTMGSATPKANDHAAEKLNNIDRPPSPAISSIS